MSLTDYIQDATFAELCECLHHPHLLVPAAAVGRPNWNIALECVCLSRGETSPRNGYSQTNREYCARKAGLVHC